MERYRNYINGKWVEPAAGKTYTRCNPADRDDILGEFPLSGQADQQRAPEDFALLVLPGDPKGQFLCITREAPWESHMGHDTGIAP